MPTISHLNCWHLLIIAALVQCFASIFLFEHNTSYPRNGVGSQSSNAPAAIEEGLQSHDQPRLSQLPPLSWSLQRMPNNVDDALDLLAEDYKNNASKNSNDPRLRPAFVQIGANDGIMFDPLYPRMLTRHHLWNGLLVEPQPKLFEKLVALHQNKVQRWGFYNGLVTPACNNGTVTFCESFKSGSNTTNWRDQGQGNSVNMKHCRNYESGKGYHFIRTERYCVHDVKDLVEKHGPVWSKEARGGGGGGGNTPLLQSNRIYFLQIDTEGHDFEIIQGVFNSQMVPPRCIHYEATFKGVRRDSVPYLESRGYTVKKSTRDDLLACLVSTDDK